MCHVCWRVRSFSGDGVLNDRACHQDQPRVVCRLPFVLHELVVVEQNDVVARSLRAREDHSVQACGERLSDVLREHLRWDVLDVLAAVQLDWLDEICDEALQESGHEEAVRLRGVERARYIRNTSEVQQT